MQSALLAEKAMRLILFCRTSRYADKQSIHSYRKSMSASYVRRKIRQASERGRRMANARWRHDRERRERLAEMELSRRNRLVVILRDNSTGEERTFPWDETVFARLRSAAESEF